MLAQKEGKQPVRKEQARSQDCFSQKLCTVQFAAVHMFSQCTMSYLHRLVLSQNTGAQEIRERCSFEYTHIIPMVGKKAR